MSSFAIDFLGGPTDRWHRWALRGAVPDALLVADQLLVEKSVHAVAIREVDDDPGPWGAVA